MLTGVTSERILHSRLETDPGQRLALPSPFGGTTAIGGCRIWTSVFPQVSETLTSRPSTMQNRLRDMVGHRTFSLHIDLRVQLSFPPSTSDLVVPLVNEATQFLADDDEVQHLHR